jgi:hypothetical protein
MTANDNICQSHRSYITANNIKLKVGLGVGRAFRGKRCESRFLQGTNYPTLFLLRNVSHIVFPKTMSSLSVTSPDSLLF